MCSSTLEHTPCQRCRTISFTPLLTCSFGKIAVCRCNRARLSRGCHFRESAPCLALWVSLSLLLRGLLSLLLRGLSSLSSLTRVSSLVLLVSQHSLLCEHARTHSSVEHTSAVSTVTVRDHRDQPSSSPRATSSRSPCITGSSYSSSSPGVLLARHCTRVRFTQQHRHGHRLHRLSLSHSRIWFASTTPVIFLQLLITSWSAFCSMSSVPV